MSAEELLLLFPGLESIKIPINNLGFCLLSSRILGLLCGLFKITDLSLADLNEVIRVNLVQCIKKLMNWRFLLGGDFPSKWFKPSNDAWQLLVF